MATERPAFDHTPPARPRGIGPFSFRQLATIGLVVVVVAAVLRIATTPVANLDPGATDFALPTQFVIGSAVPGLGVGQSAPELAVTRQDGTTVQLTDLKGDPVRLDELRGKLVWLNFWASWCPPCQSETPVLREMDERYREQGLAIVGIAVQETTPQDIAAYAERYDLQYPIAFDASADIFHAYRVWGLPTQFFIDPQGRVLEVAKVMDEAGARARIEAWLPKAAPSSSASHVAQPAPGASTPPAS
jgi:peroxiredoxin